MVEIIKDIANHIQEIVRGEIRLAGIEIREEASKGWTSVRLLIAGALLGFLGFAYLMLSMVYALTLILPAWAAAASVGALLAVVAAILVSSGMEKWKLMKSSLKRSTDEMEENMTWLKKQVKS